MGKSNVGEIESFSARQKLLAELQAYHPGRVVERMANKERIRVCNASPLEDPSNKDGAKCHVCDGVISGTKCLRHEKGGLYLLWECFNCYVESK